MIAKQLNTPQVTMQNCHRRAGKTKTNKKQANKQKTHTHTENSQQHHIVLPMVHLSTATVTLGKTVDRITTKSIPTPCNEHVESLRNGNFKDGEQDNDKSQSVAVFKVTMIKQQ